MKPVTKLVGVVLTSTLLLSTGAIDMATALPASANEATQGETPGEGGSERETYPYEAAIKQIHTEVNDYRESLGLKPLKYNYNIAFTANLYAKTVSNSTLLPHDKEWWTRGIVDLGRPYAAGENLAYTTDGGSETINASKIFGQWKNSEGHNKNLMNANYTEVGYGAIVKNNRLYLVQRFLGYNDDPSRYPSVDFTFDNPSDLPTFEPTGVDTPRLSATDVRLGRTLSLEGFSENTFTHPGPIENSSIRWYGEDYDEPMMKILYGEYFEDNPEGLINLMWVGNNFPLNAEEDQYKALVGKKLWAEYYKTSPYSSTPQKITIGPFIIKAAETKNITAPSMTGSPEFLSTVTAETGEWENADEYSYQWYRNGVAISGAKSKTYTIPESFGNKQTLSVKVSGWSKDTQPVVASSENVIVEDKRVINSTDSSITGTFVEGSSIKANITWEKTPSTVTYAWTRDGQVIPGATGNSYTLTKADVGKQVNAVVTANGVSTKTINGQVVNSKDLVLKVPMKMTGSFVEGHRLVATPPVFDQNTDSVSYEWTSNGVVVSNEPTYTLKSSDIGHTIKVTVTSKKGETSHTATASSSAIEAKLAHKITVKGEAKEGSTLSTTISNAPSSATVTHDWKLNGVTQSTQDKFTLTGSHVGKTVTLEVTVRTPNGQVRTDTFSKGKVSAKAFAITGNIKKKYDAQKGKLGKALGNAYTTTGGTAQKFEKGNIYSSSKGTYVMYSSYSVTKRYLSLKAEKGSLGFPTSDINCSLKGKGCVQSFTKGKLYAKSSSSTAYIVKGSIATAWGKVSAQNGSLGYPTSDEKALKNKKGAVYQNFQKGIITYSSKTGAQVLKGNMLKKWKADGWEKSPMGLPTGNEKGGLPSKGTYQNFEKGQLYWSSKSGAQMMRKNGAITKAWSKAKSTRGVLKYPTSGEKALKKRKGAKYQSFQKGIITYHSKTGARVLKGSFLSKWKKLGWEKSKLGLPKGNEYKSGKYTKQKFEKGYMKYSKKTGLKVYYTKR